MDTCEETKLWVAARNGSADARNALVLSGVGVVRRIVAGRSFRNGHDRQDALAVGLLSLFDAVRYFDPHKSKFQTAVFYAVRNALHVFRRRCTGPVSLPLSTPAESIPFGVSGDTLDEREGRAPDPAIVAEQRDDAAAVRRAVDGLPAKKRRLICLRYGIGCRPHSREQTGAAMGFSTQRVFQVESDALQMLKRRLSRMDTGNNTAAPPTRGFVDETEAGNG